VAEHLTPLLPAIAGDFTLLLAIDEEPIKVAISLPLSKQKLLLKTKRGIRFRTRLSKMGSFPCEGFWLIFSKTYCRRNKYGDEMGEDSTREDNL
jgi:hypothetical protein